MLTLEEVKTATGLSEKSIRREMEAGRLPSRLALSRDGRWVAYTVRQTNWDENEYDTQIWLADTATGAWVSVAAGRLANEIV